MNNCTPTIVVVDDSPAVRRFSTSSMAPLDVNVLLFATAEESLAYLNDSEAALVFLDIIMPGKDGLTFLEEFRRNLLHQHTPVIMISAKDYRQDRSIAKRLGATEFVAKPVASKTIQELTVKYTHAQVRQAATG
ncbi:MAG: response regulator [Pseudomonadota bacterium]|nr:response regulator [Pseudomonadota bacterium]